MTAPTELTLTTNIAVVPGVDDRRAESFRRLGIRCVADLVLHLPMRYEHELAEQSIAQLQQQAEGLDGEVTLSVCGEVIMVRSIGTGRRRRVELTIQDETAALRATWRQYRSRESPVLATIGPGKTILHRLPSRKQLPPHPPPRKEYRQINGGILKIHYDLPSQQIA